MGATAPNGNLVRVTNKDVEKWLHEAWPGCETYPGDCACQTLATAINTVVDRANATLLRGQWIEVEKIRRANRVKAQKHARSLLKALEPVRDYQQSVEDMFGPLQGSSLFGPAHHELTVINDLHSALEVFIALGKPLPIRDHIDSSLWIAKVAEEAWDTVSENAVGKPHAEDGFGKNPNSRLVYFIGLVLEATGIRPIVSADTISDHLRGRESRPRDRSTASEEGAK